MPPGEMTVGGAIESDYWIVAHCRRCHHDVRLNLAAMPTDLPLSEMHARLTCSVCQWRDVSFTIGTNWPPTKAPRLSAAYMARPQKSPGDPG